MAGEEGDPPPRDLAEEEGVAGLPVRGVDPYLGHVVEEGVQARTADDTDLSVFRVRHARTLTGPANAGDPVAARRQGPVSLLVAARAWGPGLCGPSLCGRPAPYAAELLLEAEEPEADEPDDDFASDEDFASDDDFESDDVEDLEDDAELLLDDEPRLSFR
ncbi:hypothetical protein GCM10010344_43780 [Streptomyces bluensis]|nr:hypothetical protein GCM10010344_43780 [Streptomyces bluensis]